VTGATEEWERTLGRLEHDVALVERAVAAGEVPECPTWDPPEPSAPLPASLRARAEALIARQERAAAALARAAATTARQQRVNDRLRKGAADAPATYVDIRA